MREIILGVIVLFVFGTGAWLWWAQPHHKDAGTQSPSTTSEMVEKTNIESMTSDSSLSIVTQDEVTYFTDAKGYLAKPEAPGVYPGVIMIHENRGLRPEIKQAAEELAKEGYIVLAVDLYKGNVLETQDEARAYRDQYKQEEGIANLKAAVAYLRKEEGVSKLASLGWCFGGRQSVELAISGEALDATVLYYGGGMATSTERLALIRWPVLGIFGDQDQSIPLTMVEDFRASLGTLGIENQIHIYPGVGHAFANPSNPNYAPEATQDAWAKTLAFLEEHLR